MASTNHTTNYSLSQFAQTDKPAWLGDYNQDMTKIDTAMKNNADAISTLGTTVSGHTTAIAGNTSDIATAQSDISSLGTRVTAVETKNTEQDTAISTNASDIDSLETRASTLESGLSSQDLRIQSLESDNTTNIANIATNTSDISTLQTNLNNFETKFNLTNITNITSISGYSSIVESCSITLAQNSDGSIFKLYGSALKRKSSTTSVAYTAITGLSGYYGIKTTLQLTTAPDEAYIIDPTGFEQEYKAGQDTVNYIGFDGIAIDTDGYIYINVQSSNTRTFTGSRAYREVFFPCIYFNGSFGDTPQSE